MNFKRKENKILILKKVYFFFDYCLFGDEVQIIDLCKNQKQKPVTTYINGDAKVF
jgi:hypothetical protein